MSLAESEKDKKKPEKKVGAASLAAENYSADEN
jgi:hypothetical protein